MSQELSKNLREVNVILDLLGDAYKNNVQIIPDGKHNIGVTHCDDVLKLVKKYTGK
jgi:hypothetical protein